MPSRPGDPDPHGELLFVSYSRADAAWVQRFGVLLKPLLRRRRLRLWADTALRGGDAWRPEIEAAIARSSSALLLVSADFLASDFVMDEELPALARHGVRLLPVLVGDCLWDEEPALAGVHWLHDPRRDGALGRDARDAGRRDERLVAVCRTLVAALPPTAAAEPEPARTSAGVPAVETAADVPAGPSAGALSDVPEAPPGYLVRDELAALVDAVTPAGASGAVGVTAAFGLLGQGGIGKSVLAAALGRHDRIRNRFPDGVFWVTVGERPDVLAVQLDLLARLGARGPAPRTVHDATARLRDLLRERRVLLLVDDVWSDAAALAFRVTGARGRVVYTTRDRGVVAAVGAREFTIGVLSPEGARDLARAVLDSVAELPDAADRAFAAVDRVALAVALLAAAVRGGRSWEAVADSLRHDVDVYGDHPYANTFKAMQVAVAALPAGLAAALLGLAVFPPDTAVPVAAVGRYWAHTRGPEIDAGGDLDRLAAGGVLRRDGDEIGFHDLQHDYLLLHSPGLPALHADLVDAYRALLPDGGRDGWWRLPPDEPYVRDHLVGHLAGAGERRALAATVTDPAYLARRVDGAGLHAAEADLARTADVLPEHRVVAWWQRWLARHASFLAASGAAPVGSVAATMRAWLEADPSRPVEVAPARLGPLLPSPYLAVRWGLSSPEPALVRALTGHRGDVRAVAWSPDGTLVAGGAADGGIRLWNPETGDTVAAFSAGRHAVDTLAWSPDGRRLAVATRSDIVVCDARGRAVAAPLAGRFVRDLTWSPGGHELVVVAGVAGELRLRDPLGTGRDEVLIDRRSKVVCVAASVEQCFLAAATEDGTVEIWDSGVRRRVGAARRFPIGVRALSWTPDGDTLAIVGTGRIHLWRPGDDTVTVLGEADDLVTAVAWSPVGDRLAIGGREVRLWDRGDERPVRLGSHTDLVRSVSWSPDGRRLASAGGDREVQVWDAAAAAFDAADGSARRWVHAVAVSHADGRVATLEGNRTGQSWLMQVREGATGRVRAATVPATGSAKVLAWSPDDRTLLVGAGRSAVRWDPVTDRTTEIDDWSVGDQTGSQRSTLAWTTDGRRLAVAHRQRIYVWDDEGGAVDTIRDRYGITAMSWSVDGTQLAACGLEGIVVWRVGDSRVRARLRRGGVQSAVPAWSADASWLAVAAPDAPLLLWELAGNDVRTLPGRLGPVSGVAWSPDGRHVLTAAADGAVVVHPVDGSPGTSLQLAGATCVAWRGDTIAVGQRTGPAVLELRTPTA